MRHEALDKAAQLRHRAQDSKMIKILAQLGTADQQSLDGGLGDCLGLLGDEACLGS